MAHKVVITLYCKNKTQAKRVKHVIGDAEHIVNEIADDVCDNFDDTCFDLVAKVTCTED